MDISQKLARSRSTERLNYPSVGCLRQSDPLIRVESSEKIMVEPVWELEGDFDGRMYADYIINHPEYNGVYVRAEVLKRLETAASLLLDRYKLVMRAGHRPVEVQKRILEDCIKRIALLVIQKPAALRP